MVRKLGSLGLVALIPFFSSTYANAESPDKSGNFRCQCDTVHCSESDEFTLKYDRERLYLEVQGEKWNFSGYVSRQESLSTGEVLLLLPKGVSVLTGDTVLRIRPDGTADLNRTNLECVRE